MKWPNDTLQKFAASLKVLVLTCATASLLSCGGDGTDSSSTLSSSSSTSSTSSASSSAPNNPTPVAVAMPTDKWFAVVNNANGLAFDIDSFSTETGAALTQWNRGDTRNQLFRLVTSGDNYYRMIAQHSSLALDVLDFNLEEGADIIQWTDLNGENQQFQFMDLHDGNYQIVNQLTGLALAPENFSDLAATRISQYTPDVDNPAQQWQLIEVADYASTSGDIFKPHYIMGADITHTLEYEAGGWRYYDNGQQKDVLRILSDHGFNFIRMRAFVCPTCRKANPTSDKDVGYAHLTWQPSGAPADDWAGTEKTIELAKRVKACNMGVFLDMHLSDTWASIGHQYVPMHWMGKNLETEAYNYAKDTVQRMIDAGVKPDMVQCGNENNSRVSGQSISNRNAFVGILNACNRAVRELDPNIPLVAQHGRPRPDGGFQGWADNLWGRSPQVDVDAVCGSTYGTTNNGGDWRDMFGHVINQYDKAVLSCEYTNERRDLINSIMRGFPNDMGWGTFLWEPVVYPSNARHRLFDRDDGARRFTSNGVLDGYIQVARDSGLPIPATPTSELAGTTCQ